MKKTFKNLSYDKERIESLRNIEEYETIENEKRKKGKKGKKEKKIINYFLFTDLLVQNRYIKIFDFNQIKPNIIIKELKAVQNENNSQANNIIRVKNYLSTLL